MHELREARAANATITMTEEQFVEWCDEDIRAEFVDGTVVVHLPDSIVHAELFGFLYLVVRLLVSRRQLGKVLGPNVQIRLREGLRRVPDLLFISEERLHLLRRNHFEGAPDVAFEIVSPDSVARDWREKFMEYEAAGVREYFILDPGQQRMVLYRLIEGKYVLIASENGILRSQVIPGLYLREEWLWQDPLPDPIVLLQELGVL